MKRQAVKDFFIRFRPVILSFAVPFVLIGTLLLFLLLKYDVAVIGGDCTAQMIPFMAEFRRKILSGESLFYSWSGGGGYDFWAVYCYYLSSPFTWLCLLIKEESLPLFVNFLVLLKLSFCGAGFSYYAINKNLCKTEIQTALFSTLYALCGYTAAYSIDIMWLEAVALFPLLILGMDKIIYEKKPMLYTLTLALTFMCNYYLGFTVAVGVIFFYFTYRFENFKDFLFKSVRMLGFSVLSAACCSVFLFPSFLVASEAGRTDNTPRYGFLDNFWDSIQNLLFFDTPVMATDSASTANIYVTVFALFFVFLWFFACKAPKREKIKNGIIIAFLILSFNLGTLNMIWHGFRMPILVQNRFSFMLCFILLVLAAKTFAQKEQLDRTKAVWGSIAFLAFVVILCFADTENIIRIVFSLLAAAAYIFVFFKIKNQRAQFAVYAVCAVIGVTVCFTLGIKNGTGQLLENVYEPSVSKAVEEIQTEETLYREKTLCLQEDSTNSNCQILYGLRGFPIFSSYINSVQTTQYIRFGLVNYQWDSYAIQHFDGQNLGNFHAPNTFNTVAESLSGVRYIYTYTDNPLNSDLMRCVYDADGVRVYENEYALPIGFQLSNDTLEKIENMGLFPHSVYNSIGTSHDLAIYKSCITTISAADNTKFEKTHSGTYFFYSENDDPAEMTFRYKVREDGTALTLYYGGQQQTAVTVSCGDTVCYEHKGFFSDFPDLGTFNAGDTVEIKVKTDSYASVSVELLQFNKEDFVALCRKLNQNALQISESSSDRIVGTITVGEEQSLFTTIPYSENWTAFADGEQVPTSSLNGGFLVLPLTQGEHTVELCYTSPAFWECLIVSIVGIIFSFVIFAIYHKKTKVALLRKDEIKNEP